MGKTADATLRIRAKNLAKKDLRDVTKDLDGLADSQKRNATAAGLAARSLAELTAEQKTLSTVSKELQRRGGLIGNLQTQKADLDELKGKIAAARVELERLKGVQARGGFGTENIGKQIARVVKDIKQLENKNASIGRSFTKNAEAAAQIGINLHGADQALAEINKQAARTEGLMVESAAAVERYNGALVESRAALNAQEAAQKEITAEAQRRNQLEAQAASQRRAEAAQRAAELREQAALREHITKAFLSRPAPSAAPTLGPAGDKAAVQVARETAFRERLINVLRRQKDGGEKLIASDGRLAAKTRELTAALDRQGRSLDRNNKLGGIFADTGRKSLSVYQRLRGQILSTVAAYVGLYQVVNLVKSAITVQQERRKIGIQLQTANGGDTAAAARDMKFLRDEADRLGLVFEDVAKNFANYKIAAKAVGAGNKTIRESFTQATEIVTGLALSADDADGVFRAFVQILGKARVQAEELRGQLGDRLPGAVAAFAKANNIALSDLDKHLKKGQGSVQEFLNFLKAYADQTKNAVDQNSKSLFAQFNRLTNAWRDFLQQFAETGVSKELLNVVNALIEKLKGTEGEKFGKELAAAFVSIGKAVLWVIENFDLFVKVAKAFLILNIAKAVVGIASSFLVTGKRVYDAGKAFVAFTAATNAARIAGTGLTTSMRVMMALLGPVGVALGVVTIALYRMEKAEAAASARTEQFISRMQALRGAQGKAINAAVQDNRKAAEDTLDQIHDTEAKLAKAKKLREDAFLGVLGDKMEHVNDAFRDEKQSVEALTDQLALLRVQHQGYVASVINGSKRVLAFEAQEKAAREADANSKDTFVTATPGEDDSGEKAADKAARAAEILAEKRHDITDRADKALLQLEEDLAKSRVDVEVGTQEQIDANLKASLDAIAADVAKRKVELEGLLHDAQRIGASDATATTQKAIDKLPGLQAELEARARIKATTDSIELQEKKINELIAARDAQIDLINTKVQLGILTEVEGRQQAIDKQLEYKGKIEETIQALIVQLQALKDSDPDLAKALHVDELIAKLETSKLKAAEVVTTTQLIAKNLGGQLSQGVASFFSTFIRGATGGIEGVNGIGAAFKNALSSFQEFLANFLVGIGEAILQAILLQAIMNAIKGTSGGYGAAAAGALTGHTGGVVRSDGIGSGNPVRQVSAAMFAGAQRFHGGGLPGLKSGEVPAILKTGEEVLTGDDPRNVLNGGKGGGGGGQAPMDVTIVNAVDSADVFAAGAKRVGRKVIANVIQADVPGFRRLLGIE